MSGTVFEWTTVIMPARLCTREYEFEDGTRGGCLEPEDEPHNTCTFDRSVTLSASAPKRPPLPRPERRDRQRDANLRAYRRFQEQHAWFPPSEPVLRAPERPAALDTPDVTKEDVLAYMDKMTPVIPPPRPPRMSRVSREP